MEARDTILATYDRLAAKLSTQYDTTTTEKVFPHLRNHLPRGDNLRALDIACGNGRDAHWLAEQGFKVRAIDGSPAMLLEALTRHPHPDVTYAHDLLPELTTTKAADEKYDFVLIGGVWMHVHPARRAEALDNVLSLSNPGARILVNLRHGAIPDDRPMFDVSTAEMAGLAEARGLKLELIPPGNPDQLGRHDVWWEDVYLHVPASAAPLAQAKTRLTPP